MCSYIDSPRYGKNKFPIFDYSQIRPIGTPIAGFGGLASGPDPLEKLHKRVESYLDTFCIGYISREDGTQKPYNHTRLVADVFNAIGACVVAGNVRRCLPGDAKIHTKKGMISIKDIEIGDEVMTMNGYYPVSNKFEQGEQNLIKIITQDGEFRCTPNHKMAVLSSTENYEWKEASTLSSDDRLIGTKSVLDGIQPSLPKWYPVTVLEIKQDICENTYDIEVSEVHEFFCEGYLTHNSAEICMGDVEDDTFINLKNYNDNPERGEIGWMSNNSVVLKPDCNYEDFTAIPEMARRIIDNGEPGMINLVNVQKYGRYGKEMKDDATLVNPCGKFCHSDV